MTVAMEQHQAWQEARKRLDGSTKPKREAKAITLLTMSAGRVEQVVRISPDVPLPSIATERQRPRAGDRPGPLPKRATEAALAILAFISRKHSVSVNSLRSPQRLPYVVAARQEAYYRLMTECALSSPEVGRLLNRDPSTVMHGVRMHAKRHGRPLP